MNDDRGAKAIRTEYQGITFRSQTEARWAVFFDRIGVTYKYEPERIQLSSGEIYIPDFYIKDFEAYFEVKPSNEQIVSEECRKARLLSHDKPGQRVWLSIGAPAAKSPKILVLERWGKDTPIEHILANQENRFWIHEDRRDEKVYWLHHQEVQGFVIGGPGEETDHMREPMNHWNVEAAYELARSAFR